MLLTGFALRNIPVVTEAVYIDFKWSASLRNIALAVILARAGLGLDPSVRRPHRTRLLPCDAWPRPLTRPRPASQFTPKTLLPQRLVGLLDYGKKS